MDKLESIRCVCAACDVRSPNILPRWRELLAVNDPVADEHEVLVELGWRDLILPTPKRVHWLCPACARTPDESLALVGLRQQVW